MSQTNKLFNCCYAIKVLFTLLMTVFHIEMIFLWPALGLANVLTGVCNGRNGILYFLVILFL